MSMPAECRCCTACLSPRGKAAPEGSTPHARRGLCWPCYWRAQSLGKLNEYPATNARRATAALAEDFAFLVESIGGVRTDSRIGWDVRTRYKVAQRLNVNVETLDRALYRDKARAA